MEQKICNLRFSNFQSKVYLFGGATNDGLQYTDVQVSISLYFTHAGFPKPVMFPSLISDWSENNKTFIQ